mmetsp:Transcript_32691/g.47989  ORF Transcript_32691/g.47989 Transcript_32691/m.47989 type:complete len:455 (+) Transcript_32691:66-1430(+)|eukprot:CAMPEP_0195520544 /NCGR_PEP_ID=MMETSP0794_2-20130614/17126_1 /TAXON_ID=515487 /ORGANISM="Stephanopyxis turris, Strain CCMP 815" /LENGTH=454 /DNA_ID=CAMNT_0040649925 /DNA_START=51 /DNA_END=1415 /DNA_ORIENTATION=+
MIPVTSKHAAIALLMYVTTLGLRTRLSSTIVYSQEIDRVDSYHAASATISAGGSSVDGLGYGSVQRRASIEPLKYLTFGTSQSYGGSLPNRLEEGYPYLLSPHVLNLGIPGNGPRYPYFCTRSMVGDDLYDVIVLEFPFGREPEVQAKLARRLRQRFPDAVLILTRYWYPLHIQVDDGNQMKRLDMWATDAGFDLHSDEFMSALREVNTIPPFFGKFSGLAQAQDDLATKVGAHIYTFPFPGDEKLALEQHRHFFDLDMQHFSVDGHQEFARGIKKIVVEAMKSYPSKPRLGTWAPFDQCQSWYYTGESPLQHSEDVAMRSFQRQSCDGSFDDPKYSLEIGPDGGTVTVNNPHRSHRDLYLTFMATGPHIRKYPRIKLVYPSAMGDVYALLDPHSDLYPFDHHIRKMAKIGGIDAGETVLAFHPIEETGKPFRLVSVSLVPHDPEEQDPLYFLC